MKALLAIGTILAATCVWSGDTPATLASATAIKGEVLEARDVESYTYLRLKTSGGEVWAAVGKAPVSPGAEVTIENATVMENFASQALQKTFPRIVFGTLAGREGSEPLASDQMAIAHASLTRTTETGAINVPKAEGANARTVAEIVSQRSELKDKPVVVRGKIVKYNPQILGKNWIHLRDGSGDAADNSHDILVTTTDPAKLGDIVTVAGTVRTDKDFGAGYAYKVLVEAATLQP